MARGQSALYTGDDLIEVIDPNVHPQFNNDNNSSDEEPGDDMQRNILDDRGAAADLHDLQGSDA